MTLLVLPQDEDKTTMMSSTGGIILLMKQHFVMEKTMLVKSLMGRFKEKCTQLNNLTTPIMTALPCATQLLCTKSPLMLQKTLLAASWSV